MSLPEPGVAPAELETARSAVAGLDAGPRLVLLRHGQTDANVAKALDTVPPGPPLNARGLAQAEAVADSLARARTGRVLTAVHTSVAVRARQTAAPVAARHGLEPEVVDGVHEIFGGDLEGRHDEAARETFARVNKSWAAGELDRPLPGGESARQLRARFLPALRLLWDRCSGEPDPVVVLVSHGAAIRVVAAALMGGNTEVRYVPNAGRVVLAPPPGELGDLEYGGWRLAHWDQGAPLEGDATGGSAP